MPPRLLVLSNGHGEDLIALRVLEALRQRQPQLQVAVLPLVGEGHSFERSRSEGWLQLVGPRRSLPSGGFSNQSAAALLADLLAGLPLLSWQQWQLVRRWGRSGAPILAVGDLLPLLLAWGAGGPFGFIGTPKSDFTWASPGPAGWGRSRLADGYHRCKGSEWDPWEWGLMGSRRCRLVALRDRLSARGLRRHGVAAMAPGNPMMDGLEAAPLPAWLAARRRVLLLPGSRLPESLTNLKRLLAALPSAEVVPSLSVLLATGARPGAAEIAPLLEQAGWRPVPPGAGGDSTWGRGSQRLLLGAGRFAALASWAEVGIATAGTATDQLVGLGVPALSLPGPGPQFIRGFARRQSRLLGGAVLPCTSPADLNERLQRLLADGQERQRLGAIGRRRMGAAGGSARLAALIEARLLAAAGGRG